MKKSILMSLFCLLFSTALFGQEYTLNLKVDSAPYIQILVQPSGEKVVEGSVTFPAGQEITLTAVKDIPNIYCAPEVNFLEWSGDVPEGSTNIELSIIMDGDKTITALCNFFPRPCPPPADVGMTLSQTTAIEGEGFSVKVSSINMYASSSYSVTLNYDPSVITLDESASGGGFLPDFLAEGMLNGSLVEPGKISISGGGYETGLTIYFKGVSPGTSFINLEYSSGPAVISGGNKSINIIPEETLICGDVDGDGKVTIVDAMRLAQYQIMIVLPGPIINPAVADVDCSGSIDILDALQIARVASNFPNYLNCCF